MIKKKYFSLFSIIVLIILIQILSDINASSIKIANKNRKINQSMKPSSFSFHPLEITFKYPNLKQSQNIKLIKKYLSHISLFLGRLIYTKNFNKKINYNKDLLRRLKIKLTQKEEKAFKEEEIKSDLLLVVKFVSYKTRIVGHDLFTKNDEDDTSGSRRTYSALLKIKKDYDFSESNSIDEFKMIIIRDILNILGFRKEYLKESYIRTNFEEIPTYIIENSKAFQSYKKYLNLTNQKFIGNKFTPETRFYKTYWDDDYGVHDIMSKTIHKDLAFTELTIEIMNEFYFYTINQCDIFKYRAGFGKGFSCVRPAQDCIDIKELNNYFLEYNLYKDYNIKCYLNTRENLLNKQCGVIYGNVINKKLEYRFCPSYKQIRDTSLFLSQTNIPELDIYPSQKLRLIKNSKSCPKGSPRAVFFSVPPSIFDEFKNQTNIDELVKEINDINKDVQFDEIIIPKKDKKYFVTYEAYDDYYSRESVWKVLNHSGVIRSFAHYNTHNLLIKNPYKEDLVEMGMIPKYQRMFSYTNFKIISHKDLTYSNYFSMKKKFPKDFDYMPETYGYPADKEIIEKKFKDYKLDENDLWLIKPKTGSLGEGIYIFQNLTKTPDVYLLTKYISNPHLINRLKYDFRIYVFITGLKPLKIYLYKEGMVRFATEEYTINKSHLNESYIHLTNVHINQKNKKDYKKANNADTDEGSKWSLTFYENYCKENNIDYNYIRKQMSDIAIKSLLSVVDQFVDKIKDNGTRDRNHFKLLGFDYLLDENLKVHLLEINDRPSLLMGDINDRKLKPQLVADCLNIIGIIPYSHDYRDDFETYDKNSNSNLDEIEDIVNDSICELGRPRGRFELIFPLKENINYYKQFFHRKYKENILFWKYIFNN